VRGTVKTAPKEKYINFCPIINHIIVPKSYLILDIMIRLKKMTRKQTIFFLRG
jgi:hypothetical protein